MSLAPSIFSSTDPGAPVLTGQAGSLAALLDAVLVNGYGVGPDAKASLGWTRPFTGTNLRVYRGNPQSGSGYFLRLDDTQTRGARLRGYTTMSAISTGTGITPTTGQQSNGAQWPKSISANATARPWWIIGNERCFYLFVNPGDANPAPTAAVMHFAGDIPSLKPGDLHNFFLSTTGVATPTNDYEFHSNLFIHETGLREGMPPDANTAAGYLARTSDATGASIRAKQIYNALYFAASASGAGGVIPYPYPLSGGMLWERSYIAEALGIIRGHLPGVIVPLHQRAFADLQLLQDLPDFPAGTKLLAKSFVGFSNGYEPNYPSQVLFELGAWL